MSDAPTAQLVAEHDRILVLLQVIDCLADLAEGAEPPVEAMAQALDLVRRYADELHHGKEEQQLFPRLEQAGMPVDFGPVACMRHEHEEGRACVAAMQEALEALRSGQEGAGLAYSRSSRAYTQLLRDHIAKENQVLFPMAERMLEPGVKAELLRAFAAVEAEEVGAEEVQRLVQRLDALAEAYLGTRA